MKHDIDSTKLVTDYDLRQWIVENLSSTKKFVSQNYTRNNFELLKRKFPTAWKHLNGKTIKHNGGEFKFKSKDVQLSIYYKDRLFKFKQHKHVSKDRIAQVKQLQKALNKCNSSQDVLRECLTTTCLNGCLVSAINKLTNTNYRNLESAFSRFLHISSEDMTVEGYKIPFYDSHRGYKYIGSNPSKIRNFIKCGNTKRSKLIWLIENNKGMSARKFYSDCISTKEIDSPKDVYDYAYTGHESNYCKHCKRPTKFNTLSEGYHEFCSRECVYDALTITGDYHGYKQYSRIARRRLWNWYLTEGKHQINPKNLKLGKTLGYYQIDHIIPLSVCYSKGISIDEANHVNNLQLLEHSKHVYKTTTDKRTFTKKRACGHGARSFRHAPERPKSSS